MENYRQYFGTQRVSFHERKSGFDVILGNNGAGKSNILNALNWCFYKFEPNMKDNSSKIIVNDRYYLQLKERQQGNMHVKVTLSIDDDEYIVSRILSIIKHEIEYAELDEGKEMRIGLIDGYLLPIGTEVLRNESTFEILKKPKGFKKFDPIENTDPKTKINEILLPALSSFFLLDGEYLEAFWNELSKVRTGIENISQLKSLNSVSLHLAQLESTVPTIGDRDFDEINKKIKDRERYEFSLDEDGNLEKSQKERYSTDSTTVAYYSKSGNPRISELQEDQNKIKTDLNDILAQFRTSNVDAIRAIESDINRLKKDLDEHQSELESATKKYLQSQIHNGPLFFLIDALKSTSEHVNELRTKGELPYGHKKQFSEDLLEIGKCICNNDLRSKKDSNGKEINTSRIKVEEFRDGMNKNNDLDYAMEMQGNFKNKILNDEIAFNINSFNETEKKYSNANNKFRKIKNELENKRHERLNYAKDDDHLNELTKNHDHLTSLNEEIIKEILKIQNIIRSNRNEIGELKKARNSLETKQLRVKKIQHEQNIFDILSDIIDKTLSQLENEIRKDVQKRTFENFKTIMYKELTIPGRIKSFSIREDYSVSIIDNTDMAALGSLSKGEKLFLALSFISALKQITGYKFPLVIDTPLARVSGISRVLLSKALPNFLPDEQIIFLATSSEFIDIITNFDDNEKFHPDDERGFGDLLEKNSKIKINYFKIDQKDENTRIIEYVPKWRSV